MICGQIILEDTAILFEMPDGTEKCRLVISDNVTGAKRELQVNNEQLGAIVGTSICGTNEKVLDACEPLINEVFPADWPRELRPCP